MIEEPAGPFFHGGPPRDLIGGDYILPAAETGAAPHLARRQGINSVAYMMPSINPRHAEHAVTVCVSPWLALNYAAGIEGGIVYEVEPEGSLERRDHIREAAPSDGLDFTSWRVPRARIVRVHHPGLTADQLKEMARIQDAAAGALKREHGIESWPSKHAWDRALQRELRRLEKSKTAIEPEHLDWMIRLHSASLKAPDMTSETSPWVEPAESLSFHRAYPDGRGLIDCVRSAAPKAADRWHGELHWFGVAQSGLRLIKAGSGADPAVVFAFGLLHDIFEPGSNHGARAAALAEALYGGDPPLSLNFDSCREGLLATALAFHSDGLTTESATIGTCWDADRLQLARFPGVEIDLGLLSTQSAREMGRGQVPRSATWDQLLDAYESLS